MRRRRESAQGGWGRVERKTGGKEDRGKGILLFSDLCAH